jgi:hypothetical protein
LSLQLPSIDDIFIKEWREPYIETWTNGPARVFREQFLLMLALSMLYVPMFVGLQWWMKNRPAYRVRVQNHRENSRCWMWNEESTDDDDDA